MDIKCPGVNNCRLVCERQCMAVYGGLFLPSRVIAVSLATTRQCDIATRDDRIVAVVFNALWRYFVALSSCRAILSLCCFVLCSLVALSHCHTVTSGNMTKQDGRNNHHSRDNINEP